MATEGVGGAGARIQLCGRFVVRWRGERIEGALPGRQGRALFGYLAARPDRTATRDEIANALWPGELPSAPDMAISALLSKLRRLLGDEALRGRSQVSLELPPGSWVDLECVRAEIHRAESMVTAERWWDGYVPAATARFISERPFMRGETAPWIEDVRRELEEIQVRALECTIAVSLGIGREEAPVALSSARRLIELAPYRESGYRWLMRALEREGNAAEALRVYESLRGMLRDELGSVPAAETQELHARLLAGT